MSRKWTIKIPLLFLAVIIITTIFFGLVKTNQYSAYGECRKVVATRKGYAIWKYERTIQLVFKSWVVFNDGYNDLTCYAIGIGTFWAVEGIGETLAACLPSFGSEVGEEGFCPRDYFGVSP